MKPIVIDYLAAQDAVTMNAEAWLAIYESKPAWRGELKRYDDDPGLKAK
jgi:hypothetical protein